MLDFSEFTGYIKTKKTQRQRNADIVAIDFKQICAKQHQL